MNLSILLVSTDQHMMDTYRRGLVVSGLSIIRTVARRDELIDLCESGETFDVAVICISEDCTEGVMQLSVVRHCFPDTECIVVSAENDSELTMECIHQGAFDFLAMPYLKETLVNKIKEAVRYKILKGSRPRILIMEDDPVSAKLMQKYLESVGPCTLAKDGYQAIEEFEKAVFSDNIFHLLLLDIMVPEVHGKDVLKRIREIEENKGIPKNRRSKVIMTTSLGDSANIVESFKYECNAYLIKPIDRKSLMNEISLLGFNIDIAKQ